MKLCTRSRSRVCARRWHPHESKVQLLRTSFAYIYSTTTGDFTPRYLVSISQVDAACLSVILHASLYCRLEPTALAYHAPCSCEQRTYAYATTLSDFLIVKSGV